MSETIKLVLSLSISGSILAAGLFAVKPLIRHRLSKSVQYYLWLVVLFRLALPFSFENSIMNSLFYNNHPSAIVNTQAPANTENPAAGTLAGMPYDQNITSGTELTQPEASAKSFHPMQFIMDHLLYIWLLGAFIVFLAYLIGYARYVLRLKAANKPASARDKEIFASLYHDGRRVKLVRNPFAATPMLIGLKHPCILIPEMNFTDLQLKHILLHEITHLCRCDLGVKWLAVIVSSLHWFNPLMVWVKREVNRACELSCDEAVITRLNEEGRQAYGETLISVVAERRYPMGVLQATMCEEKRSLKERLVAIMRHSRKTKGMILASALLLIGFIAGAAALGAGIGIKGESKTPPTLYIASEFEKTISARTSSYSWQYGKTGTKASAPDPKNLAYKAENMIVATPKEQLMISTQKVKSDKKYSFSIENMEAYKNGELTRGVSFPKLMDGESDPAASGRTNGQLYLAAPEEPGEYIFSLRLKFQDRGIVTYGFVVRVGLLNYHLEEIAKYRTPYVGNHSKMIAIAASLPVPDHYFKQRYISLDTDQKPYGMTIYYEGNADQAFGAEWTAGTPKESMQTLLRKSALVVFCMVDNVDRVTFAFRMDASKDGLKMDQYRTTFTYSRESIAHNFGDLKLLSKDLQALGKVLYK